MTGPGSHSWEVAELGFKLRLAQVLNPCAMGLFLFLFMGSNLYGQSWPRGEVNGVWSVVRNIQEDLGAWALAGGWAWVGEAPCLPPPTRRHRVEAAHLLMGLFQYFNHWCSCVSPY